MPDFRFEAFISKNCFSAETDFLNVCRKLRKISNFCIFTRILPKLSFKSFQEIGIIPESAPQAGVHDRAACAEHIARHHQTFFHNVLVQRKARKLLELPAKVIFARIKPGR